MLRGWWRRRRARTIPDDLWRTVLARHAFLTQSSAADGERLRALAGEFLARKEFTGGGGFVVSDDVAVTIAAQAVLPILHLGLHWYDDFVSIVVHPAEVVAPRTHIDEHGVVHEYEEVLSGESMQGGPVTLSWEDVQAAAESTADGYNVVIHEFIHKIDLRDGHADGCPPQRSREAREHWRQTMDEEHESFREKVLIAERFAGEPVWLDPYGAEAIDEFFAVACEAYFVNRERFAREFPRLLTLFDGFFLRVN